MDHIAIIGGEGKMPHLIIEEAKKSGAKIFLLAIKGITSPELVSKADDFVWLHLTQIGKAIKKCKSRGIKSLIMGGRVHHTSIFSLSLLKMDWTTIKLWFSLKDKRADTLLKSVGDLFEKKGISLMDSTVFLDAHLAKKGALTKKKPSKAIINDIEFGFKIAKQMGGLDIGQTVVVKNGVVVAVEAVEGTDNCIERSGKFAGPGCVAIKVAKPNQDMRFDVPVIGVNTIEKLHKIGASAIAIEADKTLLIDKDTISKADEFGITIIAC